MKISKNIAQLFSPLNNIVLILSAARFKSLAERITLDIIHNDKECIVTVDNINNTWQMRMIKFFQQIGFSNEVLLYNLKALHTVFTNFFDCPLFVCPFIHGKVNNAHTAFANYIKYFIFSVDYGTNLKHTLTLPLLKQP